MISRKVGQSFFSPQLLTRASLFKIVTFEDGRSNGLPIVGIHDIARLRSSLVSNQILQSDQSTLSNRHINLRVIGDHQTFCGEALSTPDLMDLREGFVCKGRVERLDEQIFDCGG